MSARRRLVAAFATLAVGAALALPAAARAQQAAPALDVQTHLTPASATLGEHVQLTVVVRHASSVLVTIEPPAARSDLDVSSAGSPTTVVDPTGATETTTATFTLAPFALGSVHSPAIRVSWLRGNGTTGGVTAQPPAITVTSVRAAGDDVLRPLKPQASVPGAAPAWTRAASVASAVVVVLAAAGGLALWERSRRRRAARRAVRTPDVTPEAEARARLDGLLLPSRNASQHYQDFYGTISLAVRSYLAARFGFNATALTTTELEQRMTARGIGRWQARLVSGLLDRCDAAVYAHDYPDPASADHDLTLAYEIVELSRPGPPPAGREPAVPA